MKKYKAVKSMLKRGKYITSLFTYIPAEGGKTNE